MTDKYKFYISDVFGEGKYSGNQLATFLEAGDISDAEMQAMARETNFSETTFILSDKPKDGAYDVRIFTPGAEVDFAGHPTLGTADVIRRHIIQNPADEIILNLKVGRVPVHFTATENGRDLLWMKQVEPVFGETLDAGRIAPALGLNVDDIDIRFPIEEISTGLPCVVIPIRSMDALKRVRIDLALYDQLIQEIWPTVILTFCPGGYTENQSLGVRVFPIALGVPEDPATGSGNGCLAAYLVKHRYFKEDHIELTLGQGYEIGRPSIIHIRSKKEADCFSIEVGGQVIPIAEGWWG